MFNHSEGRATCSVQRATCSFTGIDQWGLRHCVREMNVLLEILRQSLATDVQNKGRCYCTSY